MRISINSGEFDRLHSGHLARHQIINNCVIIEIQVGERVNEYDIERFFTTLRLLKSLQ